MKSGDARCRGDKRAHGPSNDGNRSEIQNVVRHGHQHSMSPGPGSQFPRTNNRESARQ
jgi:hypothetical protein